MPTLLQRFCGPAARAARAILTLALFAATASAQTPPADTAQGLNKCVSKMAEKIKDYLTGVGEHEVIMGTVVAGDPAQLATGGTLIRTRLMEHLKERGISCGLTGKYGIKGEFSGEAQNTRPGFAVSLTMTVTEKGKMATSFSDVIYDVEDMAKLLGSTTTLPVYKDAPQKDQSGNPPPAAANANPSPVETEKRIQAVGKTLEHPQATIAPPGGKADLPGSVVFASKENTYGVEILVKSSDGRYIPREATSVNGLAFVDLKPGEEYGINLINRTGMDAGATISIDGLSTFHFSDNPNYKRLDKWAIGKGSAGMIPGWHMTNAARDPEGKQISRFAAFEVTKFGDEPASKFNKPESVGAITVTFYAAWDPSKPPPEELFIVNFKGTGAGKEFEKEIQEVPRVFGKARAVITIRYQLPPDLPPGN